MPVGVDVEDGVELGEDAVALEEGGEGEVPAPQVQQPGQLVKGRHHHPVQPVLGLADRRTDKKENQIFLRLVGRCWVSEL